MASFDFITDEAFRSSLEADYRDLQSCFKAEAWKAVHVLAGSIVEAVLIDYLQAIEYGKRSNVDPLTMDLGHAITACKSEGILSQKTVELTSALKSYRNLIHPGRVVRLDESVDANSARIAQALTEMIVSEVSRRKQETYGYTAEQILAKVEADPSAMSILTHLLRGTKPAELTRLLLKVAPERYFVYLDAIAAESPVANHIFPAIRSCFRAAFRLVPDEAKARVTRRFLTILKEERGDRVSAYETAFFRAGDLGYVTPEEASLAKDHLLSRLQQEGFTSPLLRALEGLTAVLTVDDAGKFIDTVVRTAVRHREETDRVVLYQYIEKHALLLQTDVRERMVRRLDHWIARYEGEPAFADLADDVRAIKSHFTEIEPDDIPF